MTTPAQLAANRSNALLSTGPVTAEGKQSSSRNALRHGLYSKCPIIPGESAEEFDSLREEILSEYRPRCPEATLLCEQLISAIWRSRRIERLEADWFGRNPAPDFADPKVFRVWAEFGRQHLRYQTILSNTLRKLAQFEPAPLPPLAAVPEPLASFPAPPDPRTLGRPKPKPQPIAAPATLTAGADQRL